MVICHKNISENAFKNPIGHMGTLGARYLHEFGLTVLSGERQMSRSSFSILGKLFHLFQN